MARILNESCFLSVESAQSVVTPFCELVLGIWDFLQQAVSMAENNPEELTYCYSAAHIPVAQKENR